MSNTSLFIRCWSLKIFNQKSPGVIQLNAVEFYCWQEIQESIHTHNKAEFSGKMSPPPNPARWIHPISFLSKQIYLICVAPINIVVQLLRLYPNCTWLLIFWGLFWAWDSSLVIHLLFSCFKQSSLQVISISILSVRSQYHKFNFLSTFSFIFLFFLL